MERLSVFIVDDESSARRLLLDLLEDIPFVSVVGEAGNAEDAFEGIMQLGPDVVLLDVQMPGKDGFALIGMFHEAGIDLAVIFVTAFEQYAIRAIRTSAADYLLKPVKKEELLLALESVKRTLDSKRSDKYFGRLIEQLSNYQKLKFRNRTGFTMVDPMEIIFCRADSNYTKLQLEGDRSLTVSMNLGKVEEMLPENSFSRISRSIIINIRFLVGLDRKSMTCVLVNETTHTVQVSRKYLKALEEKCDRQFEIR